MPPELIQDIESATAFLNYSPEIGVRVSYIISGLQEQLKCIECNQYIQHNAIVKQIGDFCSVVCSKRSPRTKERRKQTNLERHGVCNIFQDVKKIQECIFQKHGVDNSSKLDSVKKKISDKNTQNAKARMKKTQVTVKEKYGVDHFTQTDEWRSQSITQNLKKYGVNWITQTAHFKDSARETNLQKYGFTNASKSQEVITKISKTKNEKYGDPKYNNREKANHTMNELYGCHTQQRHLSKDTLDLLADAAFLEKFMSGKTINNAAMQIRISPTTLRNKLYSLGIDTYDARINQYENFIKDILDDNCIIYEQNNRTILNGLELDFFIPSLKIAIECNGIFWHSELMGKDRSYHLDKTLKCESNGIRLIHLWDYQIDQNPTLISSMIRHITGCTKNSVYARKTKLVNVNAKHYSEFLQDNHIQGAMNSSVRLGLERDGQLVAVLGAGKSRFKPDEYELHRLSIQKDLSIPGAASKLFKRLIDLNLFDSIISYANRDISNGDIYERLKFKRINETNPSYHYFKNRKIENRIKYQKHKLLRVLDYYDPCMTEWENMQANGFNRFWTTGNIKYEYKI